ncbi:MAG: GNAT family N-acetyltransferase [Bacteroidota bacterium]
MHLQFHPTIEEFLHLCGPALQDHEAQNGLMLGLVLREQERIREGTSSGEILLISASDNGQLLTAAIQTPPHNLVLSPMPAAMVQPFARLLHQKGISFPGIVGPESEVKAFAAMWEDLSGHPTRIEFAQMIYRLNAVHPISVSSGEFRIARIKELETVAKFFQDFSEVALPEREKAIRTLDIHREKAAKRIDKGEIFLWHDQGDIVSMAGISAPTTNGVRINAVYTPKELRGKGYASSNVAALSQHQLDNGKQFCFLYTDATNPTSNKIYQHIGYEFIANSAMYSIREEK